MGIETIAAAPKSSAVAVRRPENGQETVIVQNARFEEAEVKKKAEAESPQNIPKGEEPAKTPEKETVYEEDVKAAAEAIKVTSFFKRELEFETDKETNQIIVKIVDSESKEVIKQIPPDVIVNMAKRLAENKGVFVDMLE